MDKYGIITLSNGVRSDLVPRQARVRSASDCYHIIMRGNNKAAIYDNDIKKAYFMTMLNDAETNEKFELSAWCLMDNHVHIILKGDLEILSATLKSINIRYAKMHHKYYETSGHVFQSRFLSQPIETDEYLLAAVRYVHNNPVKAGMVVFPEQYTWSSYNAYFLDELTDPMQQVMKMFSGNRNMFKRFHREEGRLDHLEIKEDKEKLQRAKAQRIIIEFCNEYGVGDGRTLKKNKWLRDILIDKLIDGCGMSFSSIARLLELPYSTIRGAREAKKRTVPKLRKAEKKNRH